PASLPRFLRSWPCACKAGRLGASKRTCGRCNMEFGNRCGSVAVLVAVASIAFAQTPGGADRAWASPGISRATLSSKGEQSDARNVDFSMSADGRWIAFTSSADNLVPGDTNGFLDVFLRDRVAGTTRRVSVSSFGGEGDGDSFGATISADGSRVAF